MLGPVSRFFEGESTSEVGLQAGLRRDVWAAVAPDIGPARSRGSTRATSVFAKAARPAR